MVRPLEQRLVELGGSRALWLGLCGGLSLVRAVAFGKMLHQLVQVTGEAAFLDHSSVRHATPPTTDTEHKQYTIEGAELLHPNQYPMWSFFRRGGWRRESAATCRPHPSEESRACNPNG